MSAAPHTPEPWRVEAWSSHALTTILANPDPREPTHIDGKLCVDYGNTKVAECHGSWRQGGDEANAARIVACVNALAGLSDEALAGGWTYQGQNAYTLKLEAQLRALQAEARRA